MEYKVSVALCTFNGVKYIEQQIDSILNQTVLPDELVICDDCSNDGTVELVREKLRFANIEYSILVNKSNFGIIRNFEKAIQNCKCDLIITSDQDDVWLSNKIEIIKNEFYKNPGATVVFSDAYLVNYDLSKRDVKLWDTINPNIRNFSINEDYLEILLRGNVITGATMAFKSSLLEYLVPFNEFWIHDYWIAIIGALVGSIRKIDVPLILYRQHDNNVIGARKLTLSAKFNKYLENFGQLEKIRNSKYLMYSILNNHINQFKREDIESFKRQDIQSCLAFWDHLRSLGTKKKIVSFAIIINEYLLGKYDNYYTGVRGMLRDLVSLFS